MPQICTAQVFTTVGLPELAGEASYLLGAECIVYPGSLLLLGYLQSCFFEKPESSARVGPLLNFILGTACSISVRVDRQLQACRPGKYTSEDTLSR